MDTPRNIFSKCDLIGCSLPSESVCEKVLFDKSNGIIANFNESRANSSSNRKSQKIILDHGTYSRQFVIDMHNRVKEETNGEVVYLDAPVSGGPAGAWNGTLSIMLGGDKEHFEIVRPILELYSANIQHMGSIGSGMAAKLINQTLVGVHAQAAVEAIYLAEKMNITDLEQLRSLLSASWGQSKICDTVFDDYIQMKKKYQGSLQTGVTQDSEEKRLLWERILKEKAPAPLRNMKKDFECIQKEIDLFDKATHTDPKGAIRSTPPLLPAFNVAKTAISQACSDDSQLQDSAFVSLIKLIEDRNL